MDIIKSIFVVLAKIVVVFAKIVFGILKGIWFLIGAIHDHDRRETARSDKAMERTARMKRISRTLSESD